MLPIHKLGKKSPVIDKRTLKLSDYVLSPPPVSADWLKPTSWPMYSNDTIGDCVEAAAGHCIELWDANTSGPHASAILQPSDASIIAVYSAVTGYNPADPSTDNGTDMLSFLKYWRNTGVAGHKIKAFVALKPGDYLQLRQAVWLFGAAFIGLALPLSAQGAAAWNVPGTLTGDGAPGSWGGHCVPVGAYHWGAEPTTTVVTWGQELSMSPFFYSEYCDEAYAIISSDWIEKSGDAPNHFNLARLAKDLGAL